MSSLQLRRVQMGDSATAANNFHMATPDVPDGTFKLSRGNLGAPINDIFSVNASNVMTFASNPVFTGTPSFVNSTFSGTVGFSGAVTFSSTVTGLTASMVSLGNVTNNKQVINGSASNVITLGWSTGVLTAQVDSTSFGSTWPINVTGNAATSSSCSGNAATASNSVAVNGISGWNYANRQKNPVYIWCTDGSGSDQYLTQPGYLSVASAALATRTAQSDRSENWGFAGGNFSLPYMRLDNSGSLRYLVYNTNNDNTVQGLRLYASSPYTFEITGSLGAFGITANPSDERLKDNIAPSTVNASDIVEQIEMIEYVGTRMGQGHVDLGFSAQNLRGLSPRMVYGVKQPEDSPMADLDEVLHPDYNVVIAYLTKSLQETLARVAALEAEVRALKG